MSGIWSGQIAVCRQRPSVTHAADGTFQLTLYGLERLDAHTSEAWVLNWAGDDAAAWWLFHGQDVASGRMLAVQAHRLRSFNDGKYGSARIHARVLQLQLLPLPAHQCTAPQEATA